MGMNLKKMIFDAFQHVQDVLSSFIASPVNQLLFQEGKDALTVKPWMIMSSSGSEFWDGIKKT